MYALTLLLDKPIPPFAFFLVGASSIILCMASINKSLCLFSVIRPKCKLMLCFNQAVLINTPSPFASLTLSKIYVSNFCKSDFSFLLAAEVVFGKFDVVLQFLGEICKPILVLGVKPRLIDSLR